jgi:hypothetical protein
MDAINLGIHSALMEIRLSSSNVLMEIEAGKNYEEAGGYYVEELANSLASGIG